MTNLGSVPPIISLSCADCGKKGEAPLFSGALRKAGNEVADLGIGLVAETQQLREMLRHGELAQTAHRSRTHRGQGVAQQTQQRIELLALCPADFDRHIEIGAVPEPVRFCPSAPLI